MRLCRTLGPVLCVATLGVACNDRLLVSSAPQIVVTPPFHFFSDQRVGASETVDVIVKNAGAAPLALNAAALEHGSSDDFSVEVPVALPALLAPGQHLSLAVTYRPASVAADYGVLAIRSDDTEKPEVRITLMSPGATPRIAVEPRTLDFGSLAPGETQHREVVVRNEGHSPLSIRRLAIDAPPSAGFRVAAGALTLASGAARAIAISYTASACSVSSGRLTVESDDPRDATVAVSLAGRPTTPAVEVAPAAVDFGTVTVQSTAERTLTVSNPGAAPLALTRIALAAGTSPALTLVAPRLPVSLAPNARAGITLRYAPTAEGPQRGAVQITSSVCEGGVVEVPVSGVGAPPAVATFEVTPRAVDFGEVMVGDHRVVSVTLRATGRARVHVTGVARTAGSPEIVALDSPDFWIEPGRSRNVRLQYSPTDVGPDTARVTITSDAVNLPQVVIDAAGSGTPLIACELELSSQVLSFRARLGYNDVLETRLTNTGNGPCTLSLVYVDAQPTGATFAIANAPAAGSTLAPRASVPLRVVYSPTAYGNHIATLRLSANTRSGSPRARLIGLASAARVEVLPPELDFGDVTIACGSPSQTVTVWNLGTDDLTFLAARFTAGAGSPFRIVRAPAAGTVITGGASLVIDVRYTPATLGPHADTLRIETSDSARNPVLVPVRGVGAAGAEVTDTFAQDAGPQVDLLFIVDDSNSMTQEQVNLRNNFAAFIRAAEVVAVDYQIGVVTTDVLTPTKRGRLQGSQRVVRSSDANPAAQFTTNANVGSAGSNVEQGLEAMRLALTSPNMGPGGANVGLLRLGAALEVIVLSDEEDQSPGLPAFYAAFLDALKGPSGVRLSSIVGPEPGGCRSTAGMADAGARYLEVSRRTGGVTGSICDVDFADTLADIAARAFVPRSRFTLSRTPVPSTIRVTVNGQAIASDRARGWTYDASVNRIEFGVQVVPQAGATIVVTYHVACDAP